MRNHKQVSTLKPTPKTTTVLGTALTCALALGSVGVQANEDKVLNIYNWSDYIHPDVIADFQSLTGIKVNYDVYESNEVLEAKLMSGGTGYDLVVPTGSFLERHVLANIYAPIDRAKLDNYVNLDPVLLDKVARHDQGNAHGVPYAWGTIGLGYNAAQVKQRLGEQPLDSLDLIFNPTVSAKLADCGIALLDSPAEVMSIALNYLGLDPNSENKADLKKATELMAKVRPNIKYFNSSSYISDLANGEVCVALGYNGDVLQAQGRAADAGQGVEVKYAIPSEGTLIWFDMMAIPADAPHKQAAHQFINFVLKGDTAASISNYVYYAVPNQAASTFLEEEVRTNPGIYPADSVKAKLFAQNAHSPKYERLLTRAWSDIKTAR